MKKVNEVGENIMLAINEYMDADLREKVAFELAPCSAEAFLKRYCELDDTFEERILKDEFGIEL